MNWQTNIYENLTETRKAKNTDANDPTVGSLALMRPGRGHGSGPTTKHQNLGGSAEKRGVIYKRTVISPGSRSSGKGMKKGDVSYSRLTNKPRSQTHPGQEHHELADVPATTPAPIEGRIRDMVAQARRLLRRKKKKTS